MKISLIQSNLKWEDPEANRNEFEKQIEKSADSDLIVLPEMFTTGFTMNPQHLAEHPNGTTTRWMQKLAKRHNCAITGSIIAAENSNYYNRLLFVEPSGKVTPYDKRHLFSYAGEDKIYSRGEKKVIIEYNGWRICPLICYDLRFPVFSRNVEDYDIALYVANWPTQRIFAWDTLVKARAIENMCYVVAVNRVGQDGNGHDYPGHSQILDPVGKMLTEPSENESALNAVVNKNELYEKRQQLGFLDDRDTFTLN